MKSIEDMYDEDDLPLDQNNVVDLSIGCKIQTNFRDQNKFLNIL